jgi:hypothetical protein
MPAIQIYKTQKFMFSEMEKLQLAKFKKWTRSPLRKKKARLLYLARAAPKAL